MSKNRKLPIIAEVVTFVSMHDPIPIIAIRAARRRDAGWIARSSRRLIEHGLPWSWVPGRVARHIRHPDSMVLVASADGTPRGFAIMSFGDKTAHLNLLGVDPVSQRSGIGRHLISWLEKSARIAGTMVIGVEVRARNSGARSFYRRLGYQEAGRVFGYYSGMEDAIRMRHDLRAERTDTAGS